MVNGYDVTIIDTPPPVPFDVELSRTVLAVALTSGGSGYTSPPTVTFTGGGPSAQAVATAILSGGTVVDVDITSASGFTSTPTVVFTGGGGTGAAATAAIIDNGDLPPSAANDDTGRSQFDNVTNDNKPTIYLRLGDGVFLNDLPGNGTANLNPAPPVTGIAIPIPFQGPGATPAPGYRVAIFDGNDSQNPVGFATQVAGFPGLYTFTFTTALADGLHHLTAEVQMVDPQDPTHFTGFGDRSDSADITIDTVSPPVFFGPVFGANGDGLDPNSDSGTSGNPTNPGADAGTLTDRITNVTAPTFDGTAEANAIVRIYALDKNGNQLFLGQTTALPEDGTNADPNGVWSIQSIVNLNDPAHFNFDGTRTILVTAEDLAGNVSAPQTMLIFLDTQGPQINNVQITGSPRVQPVRAETQQRLAGPYTVGPLAHHNGARYAEPRHRQLPQRRCPRARLGFPAGNLRAEGRRQRHHQHLADYRYQQRSGERRCRPRRRSNSSSAAPLPDDRYTLTINDANVIDLPGNQLAGWSNGAEPSGQPTLTSGGQSGNFVARFTVDSRPEIGTWSGGSEYIDTNGNFTFDPTNTDAVNRDLVYTLGFTSDNIFAGNFGSPYVPGSPDGFSKLAAYGLDASGHYRFLFTDDTGTLVTTMPESSPYSNAPNGGLNGMPVAGNFSGNPALGDQVGLFDGANWYLDTTGSGVLSTKVPSLITGYPIVGDFDGDGHVDLATYRDGVFYFQLWDPGTGTYDIVQIVLAGRHRPAAVGRSDARRLRPIWIRTASPTSASTSPDGSGATGTPGSEWYWLVSGGAAPTPGTASVIAYNHKFREAPLGNDIYRQVRQHLRHAGRGQFRSAVERPVESPATPAFAVVGPTSGTYQAGQTVGIQWTAANVVTGSKISLCFDTDTTFNKNEHWIEIDAVAAANSGGTYTWNTTGVAPGTYYLGGYMYDGSSFTMSHLTQAITITGAAAKAPQTFALTGPTSGAYQAGQTVNIQWTAGNVVAGSKISLCYDADTAFNGNEHWIEIDAVAAANGNGSYTWNTTNVPTGTYYIAGYMFDGNKTFTMSHLGLAINITSPSKATQTTSAAARRRPLP